MDSWQKVVSKESEDGELITCPYCGGMGWVEADVGMLYDCTPCKSYGFILRKEERSND